MTEYKIAVVRGDGIGTEVVEEGLKVLEAVGAKHNIRWVFTEFPWGSDYYFDHGKMMPDDSINTLSDFDAIFLGAVGHPELQDHITLNGLLLPIRRAFDQYICERPSTLFAGVTSPLADKKPYDIDLVVVRENTEGEYSDVGGFQYFGFPDEVAVQSAVFTRRGCERVMEYAFELARKRGRRRHLTSVTKSNAMAYSMTLWDRTFQAVSERFPDVTTDSLLIDAACMDLIRRPEDFDVLVAGNLFGDIITDVSAIVAGSMGLAASANIDPTHKYPSMFEPVHGSAPDIAGRGLANPMAQVLTAAMMARHLGENAAAEWIENGVKRVLYEGDVLTSDLSGTATTSKVGDAIASAIGPAER